MSVRRVVLVLTCLAVAGLGGWFAVAKWDDASKVATLSAALAGVAAVGVAVWAALPVGKGAIRVTGTGDAVASTGGVANSGLRSSGDNVRGAIDIAQTGKADASGSGTATTGIDLD